MIYQTEVLYWDTPVNFILFKSVADAVTLTCFILCSIFKELSNYILTCSMEMGRQGFGNFDTSPWSSYAEQTGTWGVPALRLYLNELRTELDNSPTGRVESPLSCRERAVTFMPTSPNPAERPPLRRAKSYAMQQVAKSAPQQNEQEDTEITSSLFDWLPFRARKPRTCSGKSELSTQVSTITEETALPPLAEGNLPRRKYDFCCFIIFSPHKV